MAPTASRRAGPGRPFLRVALLALAIGRGEASKALVVAPAHVEWIATCSDGTSFSYDSLQPAAGARERGIKCTVSVPDLLLDIHVLTLSLEGGAARGAKDAASRPAVVAVGETNATADGEARSDVPQSGQPREET